MDVLSKNMLLDSDCAQSDLEGFPVPITSSLIEGVYGTQH
jgi:hypothetical protein